MLSDEEIVTRIKQAEVMGKVFHEMGGDEAGVKCEIELLQDLQTTRQDLRELCRSAKRIPANDIESTEGLAKRMLDKYGWRES